MMEMLLRSNAAAARYGALLAATMVLSSAVFGAAPIGAAAELSDPPIVEYTIALSPGQGLIPVTASFPCRGTARLQVELPRWRPGSYRFQDYRNRFQLDRATGADGNPLEVLRTHEGAFEIATQGQDRVAVHYTLDQRSDERGGLLEGPGTWIYASQGKAWHCRVKFEIEEPWRVASGLNPTDIEGVYEAPDYDTFADCPVLYGKLEEHSFETHGAKHHVVFRGSIPTNFDRQAFLDGVQRIVRTQLELMQDRPYEHYWFLYTLSAGGGGGGGLEHLNSTNISLPGARLAQDPRAGDDVTAHEFFHLWNVKRMRPVVLGPFDYQRDNRTRALWFCEGVTSYYATLTLVRSELREPAHLWRTYAREISVQESSSGAQDVSAEDASWEVWDAAGPDEPRISYYTKGQLLGFLLDLRIRHESGNTRSLDDVVRFLNTYYAREGVGYGETDLRRAVDAVTGIDSQDFFDRYVAGTVPLPYVEYARYAGVDVRLEPNITCRPPFAVDLEAEPAVRELDRRSSAYIDGLRTGDVLLKVGDQPVKRTADLRQAFDAAGDVERVAVIVRRGERVVDLAVRPRVQRTMRASAVVREDATELQRSIREGLERGIPLAPVRADAERK